jgi:hypothetical protein
MTGSIATFATDMLCGKQPDAYLNALAAAYPDASPGKVHEMVWTDMFRRICAQPPRSCRRPRALAVGSIALIYP